MDIITKKLSNETFYAYHKGRFWRWDDARGIWKESHLMAQKFERAKAAVATLTPESFLDSAEFEQPDEYELDPTMVDALKDAKPCKTAPIEPIGEETGAPAAPAPAAVTPPAAQDTPLTTIPDNMCPAFDYSGLTDQTVESLRFAEDEYRHGRQMAERGLVHMGNAIAAAHDALCGTVVQQLDNGKFAKKEDTFRAWCCSIGITKSTAYNLLQVSALMDGSSPRQRAVLESLPPTLLYAVAKPSAPQELVEKVKNGEVSTNKAYQDLLKENQQLRTDRVNAMNQADRERDRAERAFAEIDNQNKTIKSLLDRSEKSDARADEAESHYKAALSDLNGLTEQNSQLRQSYNEANDDRIAARLQCQKAESERDKAETHAKNAEDALKKQPLVGVMDKDEVQRQAKVLASQWREEEIDKLATDKAWGLADTRNAELQAEKEEVEQRNAELEQQLAEAQAAPSVDPQEYIEVVEGGRINMDSMYNMIRPAFKHLIGISESFDKMAEDMIALCNHIRDDMVEMIIENDKVTQYE